MTSRLTAAAGVALVPALLVAAFLWAAALPPTSPTDHVFSFEQDLEGWTAGTANLSWGNCTGSAKGNCTLSWSVGRSTELAREGGASVKLFLDNLNDQGRIWIERPFDGTPGATYRVHLAFAFASADYGSVNHWTILAGALSAKPIAAGSMDKVCRGDTGNGLLSAGGTVWLDKSYDSIVTPGAGGRLWVLIGVRGTWEGPGTYYVDAVHVTIARV